jgi:beta-glucosidase
MGEALIRGLQRCGVAATVKHFAANDSETQRFTVDARVGQRVLRELYLAPFESIVRAARPWAVMAAYNSVNGHTMTESPMLNDILKGEWGFDGVVMSDWRAARSVAAAAAGLDLLMPGPSGPWGGALAGAVRQGRLSEAVIDDEVLQLLRLAARVRALGPSAPDGLTELWTDDRARESLRSTAAAGFVLARNHDSLLPLDPPSLRRMAVLGPNAAVPRTLGGGSATVFPLYRVSAVDGLRAALGPGVTVHSVPGAEHLRLAIPLSLRIRRPKPAAPSQPSERPEILRALAIAPRQPLPTGTMRREHSHCPCGSASGRRSPSAGVHCCLGRDSMPTRARPRTGGVQTNPEHLSGRNRRCPDQ